MAKIEFDFPDTLKALREALCRAQWVLNMEGTKMANISYQRSARCLGRMIAEIDKHRPLRPDGKHANLHTLTCGCEDKS